MKSFNDSKISNCTWQSRSNDYEEGLKSGQQSKQAEVDELRKRIDELEGKNKILGMRLDVIQGVMQKEIDLIIQLKGGQS